MSHLSGTNIRLCYGTILFFLSDEKDFKLYAKRFIAQKFVSFLVI